MGLTNWSIIVEFKPIRGAAAKTSWAKDYQTGEITFDPSSWYEASDRERDNNITHELAHLLRARVDDTVSRYVGNNSEVYKAYVRTDEALTDTIASIMIRAYSRKKVDR